MTANLVFILSIYSVLIAAIVWAYFNLADEKYQFIAAVPKYKRNEKWVGINYTYYGLITATAASLGVTVFYILMMLPGYGTLMILAVLLPLFAIAAVSAKLLATLIEKKKNIISVGAALFASFISAPFIIYSVNRFMPAEYGKRVDFIYFTASAAVAFLFGEGVGRLACISFGCCYGKPVKILKGIMKKIFSRFNFRFYGATKKISYASNLEGKKVVPVQVITSFINITCASFSLYLLLEGNLAAAFLLSTLSVFIWRFISEFLRFDYRGGTKISAYQIFMIILTVFTAAVSVKYGILRLEKQDDFMIMHSIRKLWDPGFITGIQLLWCFCFIYTGRSSVTSSKIKFFIRENKI